MKKDCECGAKLHTEVKENKVVLVISKDEEK
jgi:hypothetical protein